MGELHWEPGQGLGVFYSRWVILNMCPQMRSRKLPGAVGIRWSESHPGGGGGSGWRLRETQPARRGPPEMTQIQDLGFEFESPLPSSPRTSWLTPRQTQGSLGPSANPSGLMSRMYPELWLLATVTAAPIRVHSSASPSPGFVSGLPVSILVSPLSLPHTAAKAMF